MRPLKVEILAYAPTAFFQCQHCEVVMSEAGLGRRVRQDQLQDGLPGDLQRELALVMDWAARVLATHGQRVEVEVIDAASVRGLWKSLRHRLWRYPAVVVGGRERFRGTNLVAAEGAVAERLAAAGTP
jgi:hypothetical protein